jgi:hypothetical protein
VVVSSRLGIFVHEVFTDTFALHPFHCIVNSAEQFDDKIFCGHEVSPSAVGVPTYSLENLMIFVN